MRRVKQKEEEYVKLISKYSIIAYLFLRDKKLTGLSRFHRMIARWKRNDVR